MVVKFFSNSKGGSSASVDYLLNERTEQGTARILSGDEQITRDLIDAIPNKQKTCVGCLVFTERISEKQKREIMGEFEQALCPGMENRYNVLWVEHTDKKNLELNFVIPKIDLETGKSFNPYFHAVDFKRIEAFQSLINAKYNLSDPREPKRQRNSTTLKFDSLEAKDYTQLNETLNNLAARGVINNRNELIEKCKQAGIEITRQNEQGLSLKLPSANKAKRFKGGIYAEQFRGVENVAERIREIEIKQREFEQSHNSGNTKLIADLERELESRKRTKAEFNRKRYDLARERGDKRNDEHNRERNDTEARSGIQQADRSFGADESELQRAGQESSREKFGSAGVYFSDRTIGRDSDRANIQPSELYPNNQGVADERNDERINQYIREQIKLIEGIQRESNEKIRRPSDAIQRTIGELQEARERLSNSSKRLRRANQEARGEDERNAIFADLHRETKASFANDVSDRIREFGAKIKNIREQSERNFERGIELVKNFISKNLRSAARILRRNTDRER